MKLVPFVKKHHTRGDIVTISKNALITISMSLADSIKLDTTSKYSIFYDEDEPIKNSLYLFKNIEGYKMSTYTKNTYVLNLKAMSSILRITKTSKCTIKTVKIPKQGECYCIVIDRNV